MPGAARPGSARGATAGGKSSARPAPPEAISGTSTAARTAFAKQDLDGSVRAWDRVLDIDPDNNTAKLERQRALALKEKANKL